MMGTVPSKPKSTTTKRSSVRTFGVLVLLLLLLLMGSGFWLWPSIEGPVLEKVSALSRSASMLTMRRQLEDQMQALREQQAAQDRAHRRLQAKLAALAPFDLALAQARHLIVIGYDRLRLARDTVGGIEALTLASERLKDVADDRLVAVRASLLSEIAALEQGRKDARAEVVAALDRLLERIGSLKVLTPDTTSGQPIAFESASADQPAWRRVFASMWGRLNQYIIVRRHSGSAPTPPKDSVAGYEQQVLAMRLEAARQAALLGDDALYQAQIRSAKDWAARHFGPAEGGPYLEVLEPLSKTQLAHPLPTTSAALGLLQAISSYDRADDGVLSP